MKLAPLALLFGSLAVGCALPPSKGALGANAAPVAAASAATEARPELEIRIGTDEKVAGRVAVELGIPNALFGKGLRFAPKNAKLGRVSAEDAKGELGLTRDDGADATLVTPARPPAGSVVVRYDVMLGTASASSFVALAEATELRVEGRDVLLLPHESVPVPVLLRLGVAAGKAEAASSFAVGREQRFFAKPAELAAGVFLAGDLGHAQFRANDGDDFTVWAGFTAFDARWVAAETAGVRSATDEYLGAQPHEKRAVTSFLLIPESREAPTVSIKLARHGLVASVDPRATWTAPVRLRVAQALAQRTLGGRIWIGSRDDEAGGQFFSEGFSRAVAGEVLAASGIFEPADRAAELNTLLATLDASPLGRASAAELAAAADKREALRVTTARGALVALTLGAKLHRATNGKSSLKTFVQSLVSRAGDRDTLAHSELGEAARALAPEAEQTLAPLQAGGDVSVPADLIGPCYKLTHGKIAPFELGFESDATPEGLRIRGVVAGSAAEKAGLREGDVLGALDYHDGRSDLRATATRAGSKTKVQFFPAGKAKPGRYFQRVSGVKDSDC